jgi:hypothetical protein
MITDKDITFEDYGEHARITLQQVMYKGKCIAAIAHKDCGILKELDIWCQKLVHESEIPFIPDYYISEDAGYVFAVFRDAEMGIPSLLKYINERCNYESKG